MVKSPEPPSVGCHSLTTQNLRWHLRECTQQAAGELSSWMLGWPGLPGRESAAPAGEEAWRGSWRPAPLRVRSCTVIPTYSCIRLLLNTYYVASPLQRRVLGNIMSLEAGSSRAAHIGCRRSMLMANHPFLPPPHPCSQVAIEQQPPPVFSLLCGILEEWELRRVRE